MTVAIVADGCIVHRDEIERLEIHDQHRHRVVFKEVPVTDLGVLQRLLRLLAFQHLGMKLAGARRHVCLEASLCLVEGLVALLDFAEHVVERLHEMPHLVVTPFLRTQAIVVFLGDGVGDLRKLCDRLGDHPLEPREQQSRDSGGEDKNNERDHRIEPQPGPKFRQADLDHQSSQLLTATHDRLVVGEAPETKVRAHRCVSADEIGQHAIGLFTGFCK